MKRILTLATFLISTGLQGCLTSSGSGSIPLSDGVIRTVGPYTIVGNTVITPVNFDTTYECGPNGLIPYIDTSAADTVTYEISGQTMTVKLPGLDTVGSGAVIQNISTYTRVGSGSGLEGTWTMNGFSYTVISGTLTDAEKIQLDKFVAEFYTFSAYNSMQVIFTNGMLYTKTDTKTAEQFIAEWNGINTPPTVQADSTRYDVSLIALDKHTVVLKGNKLAETVTLLINNDGSRVYTSNISGHAEYHYANPTKTCPNNLEPDWYTQFLIGNVKPGVIIRKPSAAPHNAPRIAPSVRPF